MGRPASKATDADLVAAWESGEPFKAAASRLGMSPNTLRDRWKGMYGEDAFAERGRRLQAAAASAVARSLAPNRTYRDVDVSCSACGVVVPVRANRVAHMDRAAFVCDGCRGDRDCPVCSLRVDGERGMSTHLRHRREAGDAAHIAYERELEDSAFEGQVEGLDYVVCRECGLRSSNLSGHVRVHGLTVDEYRARHGADLVLRSSAERESIRVAARRAHADGRHAGTKVVLCPECDAPWDAPKSLAVTVHDLRCAVCCVLGDIAEDAARWEGMSEPSDYVTCRACGVYRAENLTSHIQNAHPHLVGGYTSRFPGALVNAQRSGSRVGGSGQTIHITRDDLVPFMDTQGRVEVAKAAHGMSCSWLTVLRACRRLNLPTRNRLAFQKRVLDAVSEVLGGAGYAWEWSHDEVRNPRTGYRLYYDGMFPSHGLIVEAHGEQHYRYTPGWHRTESEFDERVALDAHKVEAAERLGYRVLVIRYDEPFADASYLAGRLYGLRQVGTR